MGVGVELTFCTMKSSLVSKAPRWDTFVVDKLEVDFAEAKLWLRLETSLKEVVALL